MTDPLYKDIMKFIDFFYNYKRDELYKYIENMNDYKWTEKLYDRDFKYKIFTYNKYVCHFILEYFAIIIKKYKHINKIRLKELLDYEPIFLDLFKTILINNWQNIRYDFTINLIKCVTYGAIVISYLDTHNLLYLLERINLKKIKFSRYNAIKYDEQKAQYIYDRKMDLHWAWLGACVSANRMFFGYAVGKIN